MTETLVALVNDWAEERAVKILARLTILSRRDAIALVANELRMAQTEGQQIGLDKADAIVKQAFAT